MRQSPATYFTSFALSLLGKGIASVVLPLLVLDRTGDILAAGVLATVTTAASAATGLVSGLIVDRIDRRTVSVVSDILAALSIAALPLVDIFFGLDLAWFLALGIVGAVVRIPGMTAHEAVLPALALLRPAGRGRMDRLIAARETVANVMLLGGPGLGGLLIGVFGLTSSLLLATATTSALAAAATLAIDPRAGSIPPRSTPTDVGVVRTAVTDLAAAWTFLARNPLVLGATLISAVLVAALSSLQSTLMPAYFTSEDLPALTGLTLSAIAAGSIAGGAIYVITAGRVDRRTWFVIGMIGTLIGFAAVGTMASPWVVLGGAALVGLTNAPVAAVLGVLTVEATPDAMRGRVLGAQNTIMLAAPAITTAPLAAIASGTSLLTAGIALSSLTGITAVAALLAPAFRSLNNQPTPQPRGEKVEMSNS